MAVQSSKKRKLVADGIFKAELNEFLTRELAEDGYAGVEVQVTPTRTEVIILASRTQNVLGKKGRRICELTAVVQKRSGFPEGNIAPYAEKVAMSGLCAIAQAESLCYKLLGGPAVRRACCAEGLLCGGPAVVCCGSSWSVELRAMRSWCLGNSQDRGKDVTESTLLIGNWDQKSDEILVQGQPDSKP